jgi:hypothetical protein
MAFVLKDRVKESSTTVGTGSVVLTGAATGFQSFSAAIGNGNNTYYTIAGQGTSEWEVGIGTYTSSTTSLSRDTVLASSNSGSLVSFSAGTKDVFVTYPAGRSVYVDGTTLIAPNSGVLPVASGGTGLSSLGTGVATALGFNVGSAGSLVTFNGALGTPSSGSLANLTVDGTNPVGYRNIPITTISTTYNTVLGDAGKMVYWNTSGSIVLTIDASLAYPVGTAITIFNGAIAGSGMIVFLSAGTLILAGSGSTGPRLLSSFGLVTAVKLDASNWLISGIGVT